MKDIDLGKMQEDLNAFLKQQFGNGVSVSIGANIVPADKLNEKQKEIEGGVDNLKETKQ